MAVSQTDLEQMRSTADKFDAVNVSLDGMLSRLLGELEGMQSQWSGAGGRSFAEVKRLWAENQREIHRNLRETAEAIRSSGQSREMSRKLIA